MDKRAFATPSGEIAYWISDPADSERPWLVFLPGLTADHRLFEKQIEYFEGKANVLAWDAPSHGQSRPFALDRTLSDLARWLKEILDVEGITVPILIGQSLGGYIAQVYMELFPGAARGFVSIDSCSLQRKYYTSWELFLLKHTKLMYLSIPWKTLIKLGSSGTATSSYGQQMMREMMLGYGKQEYCDLATHGYKAFAEAVEKDFTYNIDCPVLLICGEKDGAGSAKRYNREWERRTGYKVHWIEGAGHNSNCDASDIVNDLIARFVDEVIAEDDRERRPDEY